LGRFGGAAPALLIAAAAVLHGGCGGSVILEEGAAGSGGAGGAGTSSQGPATSNGATTGFGPSVVSSTAAGPMACLSCAEVLTEGSMGQLCPKAELFYKELVSCVCAELCIPQCGSNTCAGGTATDDCSNCIVSSCQVELSNCANDI